MSNRNLIRMVAGLLVAGLFLLTFTPVRTPAQIPDAQAEEFAATTEADRYREIEQWRFTIMMVAAGVLIITVMVTLFFLVRRLRAGWRETENAPAQASLNDRHGITGHTTHKLGHKSIMLGRIAETGDDCLTYIVVPDNTIGRRHALIEYKHGGYWINDQGSANGTYVNDHLVTTEVRLKHGDRIRLHKFEFEFVQPDKPAAGIAGT